MMPTSLLIDDIFAPSQEFATYISSAITHGGNKKAAHDAIYFGFLVHSIIIFTIFV